MDCRISTETLRWLKFDNADDAARQVVEGLADAYCYVIGSSSQILKDGAGDAIALPLGAKEVAAIQKRLPMMLAGVIPAGRSGISKETPTVVVPLAFFAMPSMSELTAYTIVKTLYEHIAEFHSVHAQAAGFTTKNALHSFATPFHSGVIKYYKEVGIWTAQDDELQRQAIAAEEQAIGKTIPDAAAFKALGILK